MIQESRLTFQILTGHHFDERSIVELHAKHVSTDVLRMVTCLGYPEDALIGIAQQIVKVWRNFGVNYWAYDTLDYIVKVLLIQNQDLQSTEKDFGFFLCTNAACLFCLDRAVVHSRRGRINVAEKWLSGAQELRFSRLASSFSIQKALGKAGGGC